MEEIRAYTGESMSIDSGDGEEARSSFFPELKHYCLELLGLLQNPKKNASTLSQLLHLLRRHPPDAFQPFFEEVIDAVHKRMKEKPCFPGVKGYMAFGYPTYRHTGFLHFEVPRNHGFIYALFPLLLLFDAAVDCRSPPKTDSEERMVVDVPKPPHKVSDPIAEGVLQCLEELLKKCHLGSVNQMVVMLKKLTSGALLSPSEASEEFREGVIRCFRELLLGLSLCSEETCLCKQIKGWPLLLARTDHQTPQTRISNFYSEPQECLLSFLQSQTASAAVGHWLSILLKAADVEAARGHRGSAKLRAEAFMTLRVLVGKVGTADALAFFLPGIVSQLGKVLHVSKTMISGAAGSVETMDQAVRGLAEFLMIVLDDSANLSSLDVSIDDTTGLPINKAKSPTSLLEELRHLPVQTPDQNRFEVRDSRSEVVNWAPPKSGVSEKTSSNSENMIGSLHVDRTKEWISKTSSHMEIILCSTFPHLCVHPANKVRLGLLAAIQGLLLKCSYTLEESRLMLLECLFILVCDDSEEISGAAQVFLRYLFLSSGKHHIKLDVADIFSSLIERIPKVVLGGEESVALSHAQKLLVVVYFSGPQLVKDHLLQSPVTAARFLDAFSLCLGQNSVFSGSLHKFIAARPSSTGYLHSIAEMRAINCFTNDNKAVMDADTSDDPSFLSIKNKRMLSPPENVHSEYELPRLPPWFANVGSQKLYQTLAKILRLVGLSLVADSQGESNLSVITDIPLGYLRKLVSEVRMKQYSKESWQSWYHRSGSGQLVRQASTAACILNEIIYGLSDQGIDAFARMFQKSRLSWGKREGYNVLYDEIIHCKLEYAVCDKSVWKFSWEEGGRSQLIDCIGSILHEYLSPEVWELPLELKSSLTEYDSEVIIDGIGISSICLKGEFSSSGFLQSSLYVLLENLICSNFLIRSASDAVLHVISATSGYPTVGHLVLANADYIIDSICRQLRHLDLNPHVPSVLAAMLSYIGVAYKILPLLEEPMRSVSLELEILGRHHHPDLTIPFLKAVEEIAKASKREAGSLPSQAESYLKHVESEMTNLEREIKEAYDNDMDFKKCEQLESTLIRLNDSKRYRRIVGSIAGSCLTAAIPLLASVNQAACLIALNVVEDGIFVLAKVEEVYRHEKATQEVIRQISELCSLHDLRDSLDADEDGAEENRLLPAMNKIWPFFVACVRSRNPVAVRKCFGVISSTVQICGGDFFSRRFHTDGPHFWKLLNTSPFQKKLVSKEERSPLQLPYRSATFAEDSVSEVSDLKVQAAVLDMIADLSRNKKSASALEAVIKKVSGLVVGIACSCVTGLRSASVNALVGLSCMDPDLVWLLLADVYYSLKKTNIPSPPARDLPEISQMLPPPSSPKGYLYVQYGGQSYGFDTDLSSVEMAFKTLQLQAFTSEVHSQT